MRYETTTPTKREHAELIDMRTHLTVAMLAAAQLERKTKHLPEAEHLQGFLEQSLKLLVGDVERVDALVMHEESLARVSPSASQRRPRVLGLPWSAAKWCAHAICDWIHRRQYTRISALYFTR